MNIPGKYAALWSMMQNEHRPLASLVQLQEAKLQRLVRHAYDHVPFYRRMFKSRGLSPEDIQTLVDLRKLPVIDKEALKAQPVTDLISNHHDSIADLIRVSTSGSSGVPFDFFIDRRCEQLRKAQSLRPYLSNGRRLTDCSVYFTGFPDQKPKWFERLGVLREWRIGCNEPHAFQLQAFNRFRPQVIQGYPSALTSLASFVRDQAVQIHKPRLIFTDSELLTPENRRLIEQTYRAPVIDVFGSWETGNIAYECDRHRGYHMAIDCVVFELITKDGNPAGDGEEGEMVCTVLDSLAMPLIRYNLHDIAARTAHPCPCQRSFPLLEVIAGRSDDMVRLADGRTLSPQGFLASFNFVNEAVKEFQIIQQAVDRFHIVVAPSARFDGAAGERIRSMVSSRYPSAQVSTIVVDRIQREPSGKLRSFRSQVSS